MQGGGGGGESEAQPLTPFARFELQSEYGGMSALPPDVQRLRTLETYLRLELERVLRALSIAEEAERVQRVRERIAAEPPPDWVAEAGANGAIAMVHHGECTMYSPNGRVRALTADTARRGIADGAMACPICRPDTALGLLD